MPRVEHGGTKYLIGDFAEFAKKATAPQSLNVIAVRTASDDVAMP